MKETENNQIRIVTWFLSFYLILTPLDFVPVLSGISFSRIAILIPLIGFFLYLNEVKIRFNIFIFISMTYVFMNILSYFYSFDTSQTVQRIFTISSNIGIIILLSMLKYNFKEINILFKSLVFSGWITVLIMIIFRDVDSVSGRLTVQMNGVYQDPNYLNGFLIFSIIYYLDQYVNTRNKVNILKVGTFLFFVLLTGSRGGLAAVVGALFFYIVFVTVKSRNKTAKFLPVFSIILILIVVSLNLEKILPKEIYNRFDIAAIMNNGGSGRIDIWNLIIERFNDLSVLNMLFGGGAGTVSYFTYGHSGHNIWLDSLIEMGVIGTFILFLFYIIFFREALKRSELVIASTFVGFMIMGLSMSLFSFKPIWNIILLILIIKNSIVNKREDFHMKKST